jgi:hypothetical protein
VSIAILGIVMSALTAVLVTAVTTTAGTDTRLSESLDLQFAASYFGDDVAGAQTFTTDSRPTCGTDAASAEVIELTGQTFDDATPPAIRTTITTYVVRTATAGGHPTRELHRLSCLAPSGPAPGLPITPDSDTTAARLLSPTTDPTVTCRDSAGGSVACSAGGGSGAEVVSLLLTSRSGDLTGTLTARRRTS